VHAVVKAPARAAGGTIARTITEDGKTSEELVSQRLSLGNSAQALVVHLLSV
jgi:hypothetical protein